MYKLLLLVSLPSIFALGYIVASLSTRRSYHLLIGEAAVVWMHQLSGAKLHYAT